MRAWIIPLALALAKAAIPHVHPTLQKMKSVCLPISVSNGALQSVGLNIPGLCDVRHFPAQSLDLKRIVNASFGGASDGVLVVGVI